MGATQLERADKLARETVADWPGSSYEVKIEESYRNMREVLDHPFNAIR